MDFLFIDNGRLQGYELDGDDGCAEKLDELGKVMVHADERASIARIARDIALRRGVSFFVDGLVSYNVGDRSKVTNV